MNLRKRPQVPWISAACYGLLLAAWVLDLLTPQSLVVAILMNGPIALSSIALNRNLTVGLVIAAEIANAVAGYANGLQAHAQWDAIAVSDRVLLAASFVLVGYMSVQTQRLAREAGAASSRAVAAENERALRRAIERVRATLSTGLVRRAILHETLKLFSARSALMYCRSGVLAPYETLHGEPGGVEVTESREPPPSEIASLIPRFSNEHFSQVVRSDDTVGRLLLDRWEVPWLLTARLGAAEGEELLLFVLPAKGEEPPHEAQRLQFEAFARQAEMALVQSSLFERLAAQNDEIAERNTIIRDIMYALAHDIRTPLAAANTTMRQALEGLFGALPERYTEVLRATVASNDELQALAETLLLVARYELGEVSKIESPVNLADLAAAVSAEMEAIARERGLNFTFHNDAGKDAVVLGDSGELRRAIFNVVANAFSATPRGGTVGVEAKLVNGNVCVVVADDGYGVPEERRTLLFGRFQGSIQSSGGTGLGLYIVYRVMQKHGGNIEFRPAPVRGSIFTMTLPRAVAA